MPDPRFARANELLDGYARVTIDPATGEALGDAARQAEDGILEQLREELDPQVGLCCVVKFRGQADPEAVAEARARFWRAFLNHMRRERQKHRAVRIASREYIRKYVRHGESSGLPALANLNRKLHRYHEARRGASPPEVSGELIEAQEKLHAALARCCRDLLRELKAQQTAPHQRAGAPAKLDKAGIATCAGAAGELFQRIRDEDLWGMQFWPLWPPSAAGSVGSLEEDAPSRQAAVPDYVDKEGFRGEALPHLTGQAPSSPPPRGCAPALPRISRKALQDSLTALCQRLAGQGDLAALRKLCALLFLPFYRKEEDFRGRYDHDMTVGTKHNAKFFWVEKIVDFMTTEAPWDDPRRRQLLTKLFISPKRGTTGLYVGPKIHGDLIAEAMECVYVLAEPAARRKLRRRPRVGCKALYQLWLISIGRPAPHRGDGFRSAELKNEPPERFIFYGDMYQPSDPTAGQHGLVLLADGAAKVAVHGKGSYAAGVRKEMQWWDEIRISSPGRGS